MTITIKCKCGRERTIDVSVPLFNEPDENHTGIGFYTDYDGTQFYCECGEQENI